MHSADQSNAVGEGASGTAATQAKSSQPEWCVGDAACADAAAATRVEDALSLYCQQGCVAEVPGRRLYILLD